MSWDLVCLIHPFVSDAIVEEKSEEKQECCSRWLAIPWLSSGPSMGTGFSLPWWGSKDGSVTAEQ